MTTNLPKFYFKSITWGTFLVIIGFYLLLKNNFNFNFDFGFLWNLWPLILLLIGLKLITKDNLLRMLIAFARGLVYSLVLIGIISSQNFRERVHIGNFSNIHYQFSDSHKKEESEENKVTDSLTLSIVIEENGRKSVRLTDSVKFAKFDLEAGAGIYKINSNQNYLISVPKFVNNEDDDDDIKEDFDVIMNKDSSNFEFKYRFQGNLKNKSKSQSNFELNTKPIWSLDLKFGAGKLDLDLSQNIIKDINLEAGASSVNFKLGQIDTVSNISISTGLASVSINIPKNTACFIKTDMALSEKNFPNFIRSGDSFKTKNFDKAEKKLYITIEGGMSTYSINWY